jgi:hypothetical protein
MSENYPASLQNVSGSTEPMEKKKDYKNEFKFKIKGYINKGDIIFLIIIWIVIQQ